MLAKGAPYSAVRVDTITAIAISVAVVAVAVAYLLFARGRALAKTVDDARGRIGGSPPRRSWHRKEALDEALQSLERSSSQAQKERSQLAGALQADTTGIVITDDHGVVTFANQAADQFLGARHGEVVTEVRLRDAIEEAILNRTTIAAEVELFTPTRRILEISAVPLDFGIESVGAVAYIREVTEQRRVDAMRRDFISNAGHELKTPLSALSVLAETIADNLDDPDVAGRLASRLQTEATRLGALVEDILDLSQAEAFAAHAEPVHITALVSAAIDAVREHATERGVRVITEPPPPGARVSGDQRQLTGMLVNLLDNAIKYSNPVADQAAPRVWVRTSLSDEQVIIEVQDEGIGIPEGHLDRIFERFYRVDRARSRATGGTGLGLSIVRNVAHNHDGEVVVKSKHGEGSIFVVTLPAWSGD